MQCEARTWDESIVQGVYGAVGRNKIWNSSSIAGNQIEVRRINVN
jgi:hypothetical protein